MDELRQKLAAAYPQYDISLSVSEDGVARIVGTVDSWDDVVDIGHLIGKSGLVHSLVNDLNVPGINPPKKDYAAMAAAGRAAGQLDTADLVIIGGGICGCAAARQLARLALSVVVLEAGNDVAVGTTKANNGDIHPRNKYALGAKKFEYCLRGNALYDKWAAELGFDLKREGYLYLACDKKHLKELEDTSRQDWFARVPGAKLLNRAELEDLEPILRNHAAIRINGYPGEHQVLGGISYPTGGSVEPYQAAIAMAENAVQNGVRFHFNAPVCAIDREGGRISAVVTARGVIPCRYVINCAGLYADDMAELAGDKYFTIHGRKGTLAVFDNAHAPRFEAITTILSDKAAKMKATKKMSESKGGGMDRTVENNILIGSSAREVWDKEDTANDREEMDYVLGLCDDPELKTSEVIRFFTGVRACTYTEEFLIEPSLHQPDMIHVAGIQSPGLTSAPAIAEDVELLLVQQMERLDGVRPAERPDYNPIREKPVQFRRLSQAERAELIAKDPSFGRIVCRCEQVTEGEILQAIRSPLHPQCVDSIKRRTRAGMGRCQSGFCQVKVAKLLAAEYNKPVNEITLSGEGSELVVGETKQH